MTEDLFFYRNTHFELELQSKKLKISTDHTLTHTVKWRTFEHSTGRKTNEQKKKNSLDVYHPFWCFVLFAFWYEKILRHLDHPPLNNIGPPPFHITIVTKGYDGVNYGSDMMWICFTVKTFKIQFFCHDILMGTIYYYHDLNGPYRLGDFMYCLFRTNEEKKKRENFYCASYFSVSLNPSAHLHSTYFLFPCSQA